MHIRKTLGSPTAKNAIRVAKHAKKLDNVYSKVTNPVTFAQITSEYFGDHMSLHVLPMLPMLPMLSMLPMFPMLLIPSYIVVWYHYFATSKDICESIASLVLRRRCQQNGQLAVLQTIKAMFLAYKILWLLLENVGDMTKSGNPVFCIVDYGSYFVETLSHLSCNHW